MEFAKRALKFLNRSELFAFRKSKQIRKYFIKIIGLKMAKPDGKN
jgi:hypothetical protein